MSVELNSYYINSTNDINMLKNYYNYGNSVIHLTTADHVMYKKFLVDQNGRNYDFEYLDDKNFVTNDNRNGKYMRIGSLDFNKYKSFNISAFVCDEYINSYHNCFDGLYAYNLDYLSNEDVNFIPQHVDTLNISIELLHEYAIYLNNLIHQSVLLYNEQNAIANSINETSKAILKRVYTLVDIAFFLLGDHNALYILQLTILLKNKSLGTSYNVNYSDTKIEHSGIQSSFNEFKKIPNKNSHCETSWKNEHTAYRCYTCAMVNSSCMCAKCFFGSDHSGHDHVLYRSEVGGCCDCGDENVWHAKGFCKHHQPLNKKHDEIEELINKGIETWKSVNKKNLWEKYYAFLKVLVNDDSNIQVSLLLSIDVCLKTYILFTYVFTRIVSHMLNVVKVQEDNNYDCFDFSHRTLVKLINSSFELNCQVISHWSQLHQGLKRILVYAVTRTEKDNDKFLFHIISSLQTTSNIYDKDNQKYISEHVSIQNQFSNNMAYNDYFLFRLINSMNNGYANNFQFYLQSSICDRISEESANRTLIGSIPDRQVDSAQNNGNEDVIMNYDQQLEETSIVRKILFLLERLVCNNEIDDNYLLNKSFFKEILLVIHDGIANLFLDFLYDNVFKMVFGKDFIEHYKILIIMETPCVHRITVQFFSIKPVLKNLISNYNLVEKLFDVVKTILKYSFTDFGEIKLVNFAINYSRKRVLHVLSDIRISLADNAEIHRQISFDQVNDCISSLFLDEYMNNGWLELCTYVHYASHYKRFLNKYIEYDDDIIWSNSYILNTEISSCVNLVFNYLFYDNYILRKAKYCLLNTIYKKTLIVLKSTYMVEHGLTHTDEDFQLYSVNNPLNNFIVSFQIPLIRVFWKGIQLYVNKGSKVCELIDDVLKINSSMFKNLIELPLRCIALYVQALNKNLWIRNGAAVAHEANLYGRYTWATYYIEPDIVATQSAFLYYGSEKSHPNYLLNYIKRILNVFGLADNFTIIKDVDATTEFTSRISLAVCLLKFMSTLITVTSSPLLLPIVDTRITPKNKYLAYILIEKYILHKFLFPALSDSTTAKPCVSDIQDICSSSFSKLLVNEVLKKWIFNANSLKVSIELHSGGLLNNATEAAETLLYNNGYNYYDPLYFFCTNDEIDLTNEQFFKWTAEKNAQDNTLNGNKWYYNQCRIVNWANLNNIDELNLTLPKKLQNNDVDDDLEQDIIYNCLSHKLTELANKVEVWALPVGYLFECIYTGIKDYFKNNNTMVDGFDVKTILNTINYKDMDEPLLITIISFFLKLMILYDAIKLNQLDISLHSNNNIDESPIELQLESFDYQILTEQLLKCSSIHDVITRKLNLKYATETITTTIISILNNIKNAFETESYSIMPSAITIIQNHLVYTNYDHEIDSTKKRLNLSIDSKQNGNIIKEKQEAIMNKFKEQQLYHQLKTQFNPVLDQLSNSALSITEGSNINSIYNEQDYCVMCKSNKNTTNDPLGVLARCQYSSWQGSGPYTKIIRPFENSIILRDMKRAIGLDTSSTALLYKVMGKFRNKTNELNQYIYDCLKNYNTFAKEKLSWLDYNYQNYESFSNYSSVLQIWFTCKHVMHYSCYEKYKLNNTYTALQQTDNNPLIDIDLDNLIVGIAQDNQNTESSTLLHSHDQQRIEDQIASVNHLVNTTTLQNEDTMISFNDNAAQARTINITELSSDREIAIYNYKRSEKASYLTYIDRQIDKNLLDIHHYKQKFVFYMQNPWLNNINITEPFCPYCNRKFNILLIKPRHVYLYDRSARNFVKQHLKHRIHTETKYNWHSLYASEISQHSSINWIRTKFKVLDEYFILPSAVYAVTYRKTLAKLLLCNSLVFQLTPHLVFEPPYNDIVEIGCTMAGHFSLVAPCLPVQCCFHSTKYNSLSAIHLLFTHPLILLSDSISNIIHLSECEMRRDSKITISKAHTALLDNLYAIYLNCAETLKSIELIDQTRYQTIKSVLKNSVAVIHEDYLNNSEHSTKNSSFTGFDVIKYNVISFFIYGRTCYSPMNQKDEYIENAAYTEINITLQKCLENAKNRFQWFTRIFLLTSGGNGLLQHNDTFKLCLLYFLMDFSDSVLMYIPLCKIDINQIDTTYPLLFFWKIILELLIQQDLKLEKEYKINEPFDYINEFHREERNKIFTRINKLNITNNNNKDSFAKSQKIKPLYWEDSLEAMYKKAHTTVNNYESIIAMIINNKKKSISKKQHCDYEDVVDYLSKTKVNNNDKKSSYELGENFGSFTFGMQSQRIINQKINASVPVIDNSNFLVDEEKYMLIPPNNKNSSLKILEDNECHPNELDFISQTNEDQKYSSTVNLSQGKKNNYSMCSIHKVEPNCYEYHNNVYNLKCDLETVYSMKGTYVDVPDDVIFKYVKFLSNQNENLLNYKNKTFQLNFKKKNSYLQSLISTPSFSSLKFDITDHDQVSLTDLIKKIPKVFLIALYSTFPYLRKLKLLTMLVNSNKSDTFMCDINTVESYLINNSSDNTNELSAIEILCTFNLLIRDTPLEPLSELFGNIMNTDTSISLENAKLQFSSHKCSKVLAYIKLILSTNWYFRCAKVNQPIKQDGVLLKSYASNLRCDMLVSNETTEDALFDIEQSYAQASLFANKIKSIQLQGNPKDIKQLLWWYSNSMVNTFNDNSYNEYISTFQNNSTAIYNKMFNGYIFLQEINDHYKYKIIVRLWSPSMIYLPKSFDLLFHYAAMKKFIKLSIVNNYSLNAQNLESFLHVSGKDLYICLYCGLQICAERCCQLRTKLLNKNSLNHPLAKHTSQCAIRVGAYLNPISTIVYLVTIRPHYCEMTSWGSIYRDECGEEDRYLHRGKTLKLSTLRYQQLMRECWNITSFMLKQDVIWTQLR